MSDRQLTNALGEALPVNLAGVAMLQLVMEAWAKYESHLIESGLCGARRILGKTRCCRQRQVKAADEFCRKLTMLQISLQASQICLRFYHGRAVWQKHMLCTVIPVLRVAERQVSNSFGN